MRCERKKKKRKKECKRVHSLQKWITETILGLERKMKVGARKFKKFKQLEAEFDRETAFVMMKFSLNKIEADKFFERFKSWPENEELVHEKLKESEPAVSNAIIERENSVGLSSNNANNYNISVLSEGPSAPARESTVGQTNASGIHVEHCSIREEVSVIQTAEDDDDYGDFFAPSTDSPFEEEDNASSNVLNPFETNVEANSDSIIEQCYGNPNSLFMVTNDNNSTSENLIMNPSFSIHSPSSGALLRPASHQNHRNSLLEIEFENEALKAEVQDLKAKLNSSLNRIDDLTIALNNARTELEKTKLGLEETEFQLEEARELIEVYAEANFQRDWYRKEMKEYKKKLELSRQRNEGQENQIALLKKQTPENMINLDPILKGKRTAIGKLKKKATKHKRSFEVFQKMQSFTENKLKMDFPTFLRNALIHQPKLAVQISTKVLMSSTQQPWLGHLIIVQ